MRIIHPEDRMNSWADNGIDSLRPIFDIFLNCPVVSEYFSYRKYRYSDAKVN